MPSGASDLAPAAAGLGEHDFGHQIASLSASLAVRQLLRVQERALGDEFARRHVVLRMIDGFHGKQFPALEIADAEAARGRIAPQNLAVVVLRESDDEQLVVELIRPEPRHSIVRDRPIEQIERGGLRLLERVVHRFEAHPPAEAQRRMIGAIAGGIDRRIAGAAVFVHHDAVVAGQPRGARELGGRNGADADDDQVRRMAAAVGANHPFDSSGAFEAHHPHVAEDVDAVRAMFLREILRDARARPHGS